MNRMPRYVLSPAAISDMESVLSWTDRQFGESARLRYESLLTQSIVDIADEPDRIGSITRPEISEAARTYHLWHSRNRVDRAAGRVKHPRHFLLYRKRGWPDRNRQSAARQRRPGATSSRGLSRLDATSEEFIDYRSTAFTSSTTCSGVMPKCL